MKSKVLASLLLSASMLFGSAVIPAGAANSKTSTTTAANTITGFVNEEQGTLEYSTDHAYSGERSLKITTDGDNTFVLTADNYFMTKDAAFDIEYYINVETADNIYARVSWLPDGAGNVKFWSNGTPNYEGLPSNVTLEEVPGASVGDGQWYKLTCKGFKSEGSPSDEQGLISITSNGDNPAVVYVDDLKVTCTTPGGIVPNNPSTGFEAFVDGTDTFPTAIDKFTKVTQSSGLPMTKGEYEVSYSSNAYGGTRSLYVNNMRELHSGTQSDLWIGDHSDLGLTDGENYVMEFYINFKNFGEGGLWFSPCGGARTYFSYDGNNNFKLSNTLGGTLEEITEGAKSGWYKFTSNEFTCGGTWTPNFIIAEAPVEFYIDDITFTKSGEETPVTTINFEKEYPLAKNLMALQTAATEVTVSWRNPVSSEVSSAALYDADTGALIKDDFSTDSAAICEYKDTAAASGDEKSYRVDFTYTDGIVKSMYTGVTVGTSWNYTVGSFSITGSEPKPAVIAEADYDEYHTAAPSLRIASNWSGGINNSPGTWIELETKETLDPNKWYRIEIWSKQNNKGYMWSRVLGCTGDTYRFVDGVAGSWNSMTTVSEWTKQTTDGKPNGETKNVINFNLVGPAEDLWIDDIAVYELDGQGGNIVGDNLLAGIGDLSNAAAAPEDVTEVSVRNDTNESTVSWTANDEATQQYVAIYDTSASADTPIAKVPASRGYIDLANLIGGTSYDLIVKAVNSEGRESAGVAVTAEPEPVPVVIGEFVSDISGNAVNVSIDIKNNGVDEGYNAQLILGVYDGLRLKSISYSPASVIPRTAVSEAAETLTASVTAEEGDTVTAYLWDSINGMRPLKDCEQIK